MRVTYNRKVRYVNTRIKIDEKHWNESKEVVRKSHTAEKVFNEELRKLKLRAVQTGFELWMTPSLLIRTLINKVFGISGRLQSRALFLNFSNLPVFRMVGRPAIVVVFLLLSYWIYMVFDTLKEVWYQKLILNVMKELQIIRPKQLCTILSISIPTLYRWHAEGKMPIEKIKFGPNCVGYRRSDVEKWLNPKSES